MQKWISVQIQKEIDGKILKEPEYSCQFNLNPESAQAMYDFVLFELLTWEPLKYVKDRNEVKQKLLESWTPDAVEQKPNFTERLEKIRERIKDELTGESNTAPPKVLEAIPAPQDLGGGIWSIDGEVLIPKSKILETILEIKDKLLKETQFPEGGIPQEENDEEWQTPTKKPE